MSSTNVLQQRPSRSAFSKESRRNSLGVTVGTRPCSAARIVPSREASIRSENRANVAFAVRQKARRATIPSIVFAESSAAAEMAPSSRLGSKSQNSQYFPVEQGICPQWDVETDVV